jgi:hypothetical protein
LSPNDTTSSLNSIDFSSVGNSISSDSNAFSKIHRLSKISSSNVAVNFTNDNLVFSKINNLYLSNNTINQDTYQYGSARQHNYSSLNSFLPAFSTLVDNNSFKKFFDYSLNTPVNESSVILNNNFFNNQKESYSNSNKNLDNTIIAHVDNAQDLGMTGYSNYFLKRFLSDFRNVSNYNSTTDGKNDANPLLSYYNSSKKKVLSSQKPGQFSIYDDLTSTTKHNFYS